MKTRIKRELTEVSPTRGIITILGLGLFLWGAWVGNPLVNSFDNPIYGVMKDMARELAWGAAFMFAGGNMLWGAFKESTEAVRRGALVGWLLWLAVSILYALADPSATMMITNFCLALMHAWIFIQVRLHPETVTGESILPFDK